MGELQEECDQLSNIIARSMVTAKRNGKPRRYPTSSVTAICNFHFSIFIFQFCRWFHYKPSLVHYKQMIPKIRGTQDIIPSRFTDKVDAKIELWQLVEDAARRTFRLYG